MNYRIYMLLAVLGAAVIFLSFQPLRLLVARDKTTGEEIFAQRISAGERFRLRYIHSVERIPVTGVFTVDEDNRIILLETYFPSYGIGLPHEARPDRESGQLALKAINEPRAVSFFALCMNDFRLILGKYEVLLSARQREGHVIEILTTDRARIVWMIENLKTGLSPTAQLDSVGSSNGC